jgi:hypothetical protein
MAGRFEFRSTVDFIGILRVDHANEVNKDAPFLKPQEAGFELVSRMAREKGNFVLLLLL